MERMYIGIVVSRLLLVVYGCITYCNRYAECCESILNGIYPSRKLVTNDRLHTYLYLWLIRVPPVQYLEFQICGRTYPSHNLSNEFEICCAHMVEYVRARVISLFPLSWTRYIFIENYQQEFQCYF